MKNILLPILFGVSLSFAVSVVGVDTDNTCGSYSPDFKISNVGGTNPINGFKIYAYFSTQDLNAYPVLKNVAPDAKSVIRENINPHVWRVIVDYTNKVIPARGYFPEQGLNPNPLPSIYSKFFSIETKQGTTNEKCWDPYPWGAGMKDIVIESASGQVLWGRHPDFKSLVGVLGFSSQGCPDGKAVQAYIKIDEEDDNNKSRVLNDTVPFGVNVSSSGAAWFFLCPILATNLPRTAYDYMVLRLDENCPDGTYRVRRHHDAEDSNTQNGYVGSIWPNKVEKKKDVDLEFCFVPRSSNPTTKFPFGTKYGVFANPSTSIDAAYLSHLAHIAHSEFYIDDEDHNNQSETYYYGLSKDKPAEKAIRDRIDNIMSGEKNTTYHTIYWRTEALTKSAEVAYADNNFVETALVTAMPLAPVIKGLNHSVVAVELKSAGDTKVSIVGINGAVVANTAEKNLQPGVHQIKLNSGIIPNGRYVVKIEQNGMVDAKNVILK